MAEIIEEKPLKAQELDYIRQYVVAERKRSRSVIDEMRDKYQRKGLYLNELIDRERNKERGGLDAR